MVISELFRLAWARRERRETARTEAPALHLIVSWRHYSALDWSLGGCRIQASPGAYQLGDRLEGTLAFPEGDRNGEFLAEVMRLGPEGELGLRWLELSADIVSAITESRDSGSL